MNSSILNENIPEYTPAEKHIVFQHVDSFPNVGILYFGRLYILGALIQEQVASSRRPTTSTHPQSLDLNGDHDFKQARNPIRQNAKNFHADVKHWPTQGSNEKCKFCSQKL